MGDSQYLSIGEVLGLLLEDFPDVTISKIRFLESQGLIEPERTPSGYRKFYDHDVDLLRAILHEQKENFLPLKVIRDRIESGAIEADATGGRTPPRGIRNVEVRQRDVTSATARPGAEQRDSVFRRTDGGPEWAGGQALIPGSHGATDGAASAQSPITAAVPVVPRVPQATPVDAPPAAPVAARADNAAEVAASSTPQPAAARTESARAEAPRAEPKHVESAKSAEASGASTDSAPATRSAKSNASAAPSATPSAGTPPAADARTPVATSSRAKAAAALADDHGMPLNRDELCIAAAITTEQLTELESFGVIVAKGTGADAAYGRDCVEIATVAAKFLANGIDARHLRSWRQSADREAALFEQRIMPLLRQRNPQSRHLALDTLTELAELGAQLRNALVDSALRHHFDGS